MRISEMRRREDYEGILERTLAAGLAARYGKPHRVRFGDGRDGQAWLEVPLIGGYVTRRAARPVLRFVRDTFRFTPVWHRAPVQWALSELLTSRLTLAGLRRGFSVTPPIPGDDRLLVMPGNQRVRVFDFDAGRVMVLLKQGFGRQTMDNELGVRQGEVRGPYLPVLSVGEDPPRFEEPLVPGYPLPRCPPWVRRRKLEARAFRQLDRWLDHTSESRATSDYVGDLLGRAGEALDRAAQALDHRVHHQRRWLDRLAEVASRLDRVSLAQSHGDLQPGNMLIDRTHGDVWLIDWEHSGIRSRAYDLMVYGLRTRFPGPLALRLKRFATGRDTPGGLPVQLTAPQARPPTLALFVLEDLEWFLRESTSGPFRHVSPGLTRYETALSSFGRDLAGLFDGPS